MPTLPNYKTRDCEHFRIYYGGKFESDENSLNMISKERSNNEHL